MTIQLQLRHSQRLTSETSAWFLPGNSVATWLEELTRSQLATAETRLFIVPKSIADRSPAGLLVLPGKRQGSDLRPAGLACRMIADRLIVPTEAALHPPLTDAEVRGLCSLPISFFHPAFGLSSFESEATLRVWELLEMPEERSADWNQARPGAPRLPELTAIFFAQPPSVDEIFGGAQDEIGSEPPLNLPPAPGEPVDSPMTNAGRNLRRLFAKGISGMMRQIPHTGLRRTWVNDVEDWANLQLRGVSNDLQRIRNKELHRLLHLFDTDPESALRHAIPMNAFAHRGLAPPGGLLGTHSLNFDLSRLGGRAADFWDMPFEIQELLRKRYRQMADREIQLGRYRRAAYIYAELLGDLVSAANALKQGRHFREAALLYEEHLKNPLEAARCLAEGGLYAEAIERYEKLERWLDIADLQERLGDGEAARKTIRRVVDTRISQDDLLGAAQLLEDRLNESDEALQLLLQAWPSSRQAAACVGAAFQLLGRLGQHEQAVELVGRFSRDTTHPLVLPLLQSLNGPAREYPDVRVRHRAADLSRVLIGKQLERPQVAQEEVGRLLELLVRLAPEDRLLSRDANRHLSVRREAATRVHRITPQPGRAADPVVVRRFDLPRQIEWICLRQELNWFYAVGVSGKRLTLVRGIWEGELQSTSWNCAAGVAKRGALIFEATYEQGKAIALALPGMERLELHKLPAADLFFGQECFAGTPHWLTAGHYPVSFGADTIWTAHVAAGRAVLSNHDKHGRLQHTLDITDDLLRDAERNENTRLRLAVVGNNAVIAMGNRAVLTRSDGGVTKLTLPGPILDLCVTLPHTRAGVVFSFEHGASLHWIGAPGLIELDRDLSAPLGAFVTGGPLVLASPSRMLLVDVDSRGAQKVVRMEWKGSRPVGVCTTSSPGQFAIMEANGAMTVYRQPQ